MELSDLPEAVQRYWNSLSHEDQQSVLACLASNRKPLRFVLKVPATLDRCGLAIAYLKKHEIEFKAERVGEKIHFVFDKHTVRNEVLIGMNCL